MQIMRLASEVCIAVYVYFEIFYKNIPVLCGSQAHLLGIQPRMLFKT